jgi:pimeloyl-ACP methyl ester carboxylesterase
MTASPRTTRRALAVLATLAAALGTTPPGATAKAQDLEWEACGEAGAECATLEVPRDYDSPGGRKLDIAVARVAATDPENRIGSLFFNFGGPGADHVGAVREVGAGLFPGLSDRFDIVGFDPRGTGESEGALDCAVNQEEQGVYSQPLITPENLDVGSFVDKIDRYVDRCKELNDVGVLQSATTANLARDMDRLRRAVGDDDLTYLGFSYGTQVGATYASLYPSRYRALVLDGALDPSEYVNKPLNALTAQTAGLERALGRFFQACAADQAACLGFGGADPWNRLDELIEQLEAQPAPTADGRTLDADDVRFGITLPLYAKQFWPDLAFVLAALQAGDPNPMRLLADIAYGRNDDGTYDPGTDRYFLLSAIEQRYPSDTDTFLDAGARSWASFDHFYYNSGYSELYWGRLDVTPRDAFYGPFRARSSAPTTLVVGTTYDPATPYRGAKQMVRQLGNARLLTMRGDGHTAYGGNSPCIDTAVEAYLEEGTLPPAGTTCRQEVPFVQPEPEAQSRSSRAARAGSAIERLRAHGVRVTMP